MVSRSDTICGDTEFKKNGEQHGRSRRYSGIFVSGKGDTII